jgi:hypothetical protein
MRCTLPPVQVQGYGRVVRAPAHGRGNVRNASHRFWPCIAAAVAVSVIAVPAASAGVRKYDTELTIRKEHGSFLGTVWSERVPNSVPDRENLVRKCMNRRRVILFKQRPGADRKLGADRSSGGDPTIPSTRSGDWQVSVPKGTLRHGDHVYAKATRKVGNGFVCRADRSKTLTWPKEAD